MATLNRHVAALACGVVTFPFLLIPLVVVVAGGAAGYLSTEMPLEGVVSGALVGVVHTVGFALYLGFGLTYGVATFGSGLSPGAVGGLVTDLLPYVAAFGAYALLGSAAGGGVGTVVRRRFGNH